MAVSSQHRHIAVHSLDDTTQTQCAQYLPSRYYPSSHLDVALAADAVPISFDYNQFRADSRHFLALTEAGVVSIWKLPTTSTVPLSPLATIKIDEPSKVNSIHSAKFISPTEILVSFGNLTKPQLKKLARAPIMLLFSKLILCLVDIC